jgi:1-acyl-sn-glycerol-3-phosphate acyltransferase
MPDYTAFLSKDEVKAVPLMGFLCQVYDQLMIKRDKKPTKEERIEVMK